MTWEEVPKEDYVYCPECTSLAGIKVRGDTQPEIKQYHQKYPIIDIDKVGSIKIKCRIKVRGDTQPEIKQVRVTIGNQKYPIIDIDKVGSIKIKCQFCGYDLTQEILKTNKM